MWTCIKLHDIFTQMIDATLNNRNEKKKIHWIENHIVSIRMARNMRAVELPWGAIGRHPLIRSLCSFNWTQNRIAAPIGCRWIATICIAGRSLLISPARGLHSVDVIALKVHDRRDFPSLVMFHSYRSLEDVGSSFILLGRLLLLEFRWIRWIIVC